MTEAGSDPLEAGLLDLVQVHGLVGLWCCGIVVLWCCGVVVLWCYGVVVL